MGEHLGPGLRHNPPCELATYASADAGNQVGYGSDGGLYVPNPDEPLPPADRCVRTVAWLGEQSFWHGGYLGAGANLAPYGARASIEHAVNLNLYATRLSVVITKDGHPLFPNEADLSRVADYSPQAPSGTVPADISIAQARAVTNRVSNWYGLSYEDEEGLPALADVWGQHRDRMVWFLYIGSGTVVYQAPALRDFILSWCMQDQVVVLTEAVYLPMLRVLSDAGIATGAWVTQADIDGGYSPDTVKADGGTWAAIDDLVDPTHYAVWAKPASGLNAIVDYVSSRVQADAAKTAGFQGVISGDPTYTARTNYTGPDQWWTNSMMSGQLSAATVLRSYYRREGVRGMKLSYGGWVFPTQPTIHGGTVLLGWAENTVSATYSWTFDMSFHQDGSAMPSGSAGLVFACPTDGPATAWASNDEPTWFTGSNIYPAANGYMAEFADDGELSLWKITDGTATQLATAAPTDGPIVRSRTYRLRCTIDGGAVRVDRIDIDTGEPRATAEAADAQFRGPYAHMYKYIGTTARTWHVAFKNVQPSAPVDHTNGGA